MSESVFHPSRQIIRLLFAALLAFSGPLSISAFAGGHEGAAVSQAHRTMVINAFGPPDVLTLVEEDVLPEPGAGEVRVRILTASASFTDTMVRKGLYPGIDDELPYAPGYDFVGVVDKVGDGVSDFRVGQKVADLTIWGAYTTHMIRPAEDLVPVPDGLDDGEAVSLILSYTTAYQMLNRVADLRPGQSILIHGASGAVGMALAQLGQAAGFKMYGTASTAKQDFVASLGVTPIDYKTEDFVARIAQETGGDGVDVVFDAIGVDNFARSYETLKQGGTLITYGFYQQTVDAGAGESLGVAIEFLYWAGLKFFWGLVDDKDRSVPDFYGITTMRDEHPEWFKEDVSALFGLLADGQIKPNIWKTLPLAEAVSAHRDIEDSKVKGKIVLRVTE